MAMILALLAIILMTLLPLAVATQATGQLTLARSDQDHETALAAANAGAEDFVLRLNTNNNYWNNASGTTWAGNSAFTSWVRVPGTTTEWYWYEVNTAATGCGNPAKTGIVCVTASGCSSVRPVTTSAPTVCPSGEVRTVNLSLRAKGFLDYIYSTQYEIADTNLTPSCIPEHAWDPTPPSQCNIIEFASSDVINGPLHSDDALHICGTPHFNGPVDTYFNSNANAQYPNDHFGPPGAYITGNATQWPGSANCNGAAPVWNPGAGYPTVQPQGGSTMIPPLTSLTQLDQAADYTQGGRNGCVFPYNATLSAYSQGTAGYVSWASTPSPEASPSWNQSLCGAGTNATSGVIAIPTSGLVIFSNQSLRIGNSTTQPSPGVLGQLTVAAAANVVVTNNLTYVNGLTGSDVLGLFASNEVQVDQPNPNYPVCVGTTTAGHCTLHVQAAILAGNESFTVNDYSTPPYLGTLQVDGAIAQKFRGPVATGDGNGNIVSGYNKNYNYDSRLQYLTPPFWPSPTSATWKRTGFTEVTACKVAGSTC